MELNHHVAVQSRMRSHYAMSLELRVATPAIIVYTFNYLRKEWKISKKSLAKDSSSSLSSLASKEV